MRENTKPCSVDWTEAYQRPKRLCDHVQRVAEGCVERLSHQQFIRSGHKRLRRMGQLLAWPLFDPQDTGIVTRVMTCGMSLPRATIGVAYSCIGCVRRVDDTVRWELPERSAKRRDESPEWSTMAGRGRLCRAGESLAIHLRRILVMLLGDP